MYMYILGMPIGKSRKFLKLVPGFFGIFGNVNSCCITFMLNEIRAINYSLAKDLYKLLHRRIEERRTVYSFLLNFLKNPNKESDFDKDPAFCKRS